MKFPLLGQPRLSVILLFLLCNFASAWTIRDIFHYFKSISYRSFDAVRCQFKICCNEDWILSDLEGLKTDLESKVHGQHLVQKTVLGHIKGHLKTSDPPKALVLSFHGPTGVGKNFVSRIMADNLYKNGLHSPFVHLISATKEFPHEGMVPFYKDQLRSWIERNVSNCEQSMFIFDEIDKMPSLLLDVIKPYLDYYQHLGGINYRRSIFIFLSNTGSSVVSQHMLEHWRTGKKREELSLRAVENQIMLAAVNDASGNGLWHSQVISKNLVTAFIPFLPLEKIHIASCIQDFLVAHDYIKAGRPVPQAVLDNVMEELTFTPEIEQLFSSTGCKRVSEKVDFIMMTDGSLNRDEL